MTADRSLLLLLDEVRGKTLLLLEGVAEHQARWAPPGLQNTILWHAGHCFVLLEVLAAEAVGLEPELPEGWFEMFSWASRPAKVPPEAWPPLADVAAALRRQHARLRSALERIGMEELQQRLQGGRTPRYRILHALHDEACHSGEIWLLRKLQRRV